MTSDRALAIAGGVLGGIVVGTVVVGRIAIREWKGRRA